ncbi:MAG: DUF4845 domain-containing protein [Gammaproteobacteria bacterium]
MKHKQQGMTFIGWIGTIAVILIFALATMRLVPVYLQYMKIANVIRDAPERMRDGNATPKMIRAYIDKRFDVEAITVIETNDIEIGRKNDTYIVKAEYDHEVPFVGNVNFLVNFKTESTVRR